MDFFFRFSPRRFAWLTGAMLACKWMHPALAADLKVPLSATPHASADTVVADPIVTAAPSTAAAKNFQRAG